MKAVTQVTTANRSADPMPCHAGYERSYTCLPASNFQDRLIQTDPRVIVYRVIL